VGAAVRMALRALLRQRLRTGLTSLGILIGIAAVVVVVSLGKGTRERVGAQLQSLGSNIVYVFAQPTSKSGLKTTASIPEGLTVEDAHAIRSSVSGTAAVTVYTSLRMPIQSSYADERTDIVGSDEHYVAVRGYALTAGRNFTAEEVRTKDKVALIGTTVRDKLFGSVDPVGLFVRAGRHRYRVVGLLESKGQSPFGADQDDRLVIPIGTWFARISPGFGKQVQIIMISARELSTVRQVEREVIALMRQRHSIAENEEEDFAVRTQKQFQETQDSIYRVLSLLLLSVAAVSLFVGGVGVMNILLVSVNERKREIGIRMAIGAKAADIRLQFMVEAVVLTLIGGTMGLLMALGAVIALQGPFGGLLTFDWSAVIVAIGTSLVLGLVFGLLPAHRAAKLDPIEALRHE
jgi:putative ABC transport system permease protein